jgi:hypothetical protein
MRQQARDILAMAQQADAVKRQAGRQLTAADDGEHGVGPRPSQLREGAHGEVLSLTMRDQADDRDDRDVGRDAERGAQAVRLAGGRRTELGGVDEVGQGDDFGHPVPRQRPMAARDVGRDGDEQVMEAGVQLRVVGVQVRHAADAVPLAQEGGEVTGARQVGMDQFDTARPAPSGRTIALFERPAREVGAQHRDVGRQVATDPRVFLARQGGVVPGGAEQQQDATGVDGRAVHAAVGGCDQDTHGSA